MHKITLFFLFAFTLNGYAQQSLTVTCSEINYNSHPTKASGNWLELHNFGTTEINLSNFRLQEEGSLTYYNLPNTAVIPAGGYLVLSDDITQFQGIFPTVTNVVGPTGITLGNNGDTVLLLNSTGAEVLRIGYLDNLPWPQCADGAGRTLENRNPETTSNLLDPANWRDGCMFGSPGVAYTPCNEPLFVNEINYRSSDFADAGDWIELWNRSGQDINMSGWQVRDRNDTLRYTIPNGISIKKDSFLVIYSDLFLFSDVHPGAAPNKTGPFEFGLSGNGDLIRLFDFNQDIVLSMFYNDAAPWPEEPDGQGPTLELRAPFTDLNTPANWASSCNYGTPGRKNSPCSSDTDETVLAPAIDISPNPAREVLTVQVAEYSAEQWQLWDLNGSLVREGRVGTGQNTWQISTATLPAGMYVLHIRGDRWVQSRKVTISPALAP